MLRHAREAEIMCRSSFISTAATRVWIRSGTRAWAVPDEQRYYRYVIARFGAFANVMWDVTNEWQLFRNEPWVEQMARSSRSATLTNI